MSQPGEPPLGLTADQQFLWDSFFSLEEETLTIRDRAGIAHTSTGISGSYSSTIIEAVSKFDAGTICLYLERAINQTSIQFHESLALLEGADAPLREALKIINDF